MNDIEKLVKVVRQEALDKQASGVETDMHLGKSAKQAEAEKGAWVVKLRSDAVFALCDEIDRLRDERDTLKDVLLRHGFVECDIAACNCGSWHARYGLRERMGEMRHMLEDAGHPLSNANGNLISNALKELIAERDALREEIVGWKADQKENLKNQCDLVAECNALRAFAQIVLERRPVDNWLTPIAKNLGLLKDCDEFVETPLLTGEQQT